MHLNQIIREQIKRLNEIRGHSRVFSTEKTPKSWNMNLNSVQIHCCMTVQVKELS